VLRITSVGISKINMIFALYFLNNTNWSIGSKKLTNTIKSVWQINLLKEGQKSLPLFLLPPQILLSTYTHTKAHWKTERQRGRESQIQRQKTETETEDRGRDQELSSPLVCRHSVIKA
jgi:hypothetical protein